jgi:hypothetical protein
MILVFYRHFSVLRPPTSPSISYTSSPQHMSLTVVHIKIIFRHISYLFHIMAIHLNWLSTLDSRAHRGIRLEILFEIREFLY